MRKLAALAAHILATTHLPPEQLTAWAEGGDPRPQGRELALLRPEPGEAGEIRRQVELGLFRYDGVIQIERYPGDGLAFVALVTTWLAENDPDRDGLEDPVIDADLLTRGAECDVQVSIDFEERITAVEDPKGAIPFDGLLWSLSPAFAPPATALAAMHGVNKGAGKCP